MGWNINSEKILGVFAWGGGGGVEIHPFTLMCSRTAVSIDEALPLAVLFEGPAARNRGAASTAGPVDGALPLAPRLAVPVAM